MPLHKRRGKRAKIQDNEYLAAQIVAHDLSQVLHNIGNPRMYFRSFVREFWFWKRYPVQDKELADIFDRLHMLILQNGIHHISFQEPLVPKFREIQTQLLDWMKKREMQILGKEQSVEGASQQ